METIHLSDIATARSSGLVNHVNLGIVAFTEAGFRFLDHELTAARVEEHFADLGAPRVERFELPNVWALNFVLHNARVDPQTRLLGTAALEIELPCPDNSGEMNARREMTNNK